TCRTRAVLRHAVSYQRESCLFVTMPKNARHSDDNRNASYRRATLHAGRRRSLRRSVPGGGEHAVEEGDRVLGRQRDLREAQEALLVRGDLGRVVAQLVVRLLEEDE